MTFQGLYEPWNFQTAGAQSIGRTWLQLPMVQRTHGRSTLQVVVVAGRG